MALYRATPKLISRIMTGRVPARALVVGEPAGPGSPGVTNRIAGPQFRDQIDPSTGSFTMPAALAPVEESIQRQPTVRCEIQARYIDETGQGPLAGDIFMNRYFEADFPPGTAPAWINHLVFNGWFSAVGALTDAGVPAALNVGLPAQTSQTGR